MALGVATVGQIVLYFPKNDSPLSFNGATSIVGIVQEVLTDSINLVVFPMNCFPMNVAGVEYKTAIMINGIVPSGIDYWLELI